MTRLQQALQNMLGAFGNGPDAEDFWSEMADITGCDCTNPDHPHNEAQLRESILREAQAALTESLVPELASDGWPRRAPDAWEVRRATHA